MYQRSIVGNIVFNEQCQVLFISKSLRLELGLGTEHCRGALENLLSRLFFRMPGAAEVMLADIREVLAQPLPESDQPVGAEWTPGFFALHGELSRITGTKWHLHLNIHSNLRVRASEPEESSRDRLTGATHRAAFEENLDLVLETLPATEGCLPVLFLDLDRFKAVNDTLGHAVGDTLLKMVSDRLRGALKITDVLGRLGGDEFAIILSEQPTAEQMGQLASRIIDLISRPFLIEGQVVNVGSSIGIAVAPQDGSTRTEILRSADLALYHSKNAGRGVWNFFSPLMRTRAEERRALELELRKALLLRQFELHYQPQIDVETRSIIGLEGLLRWRHPNRGLLLPADFLPLAEELGVLVPIGEWALRTACKEASTWPSEVAVAVNVSAQQFESASFIASVEKALRQAGLPGSRLEIEVTESLLLHNKDIVCAKLDCLRVLGVHVTMDSFGTGLASLSQLVQFPFDKIKIDRSLVSDGPFDLKSRAILRAVSALGHSLGITTLATGVETPEHLARVKQEGCQSVQGFFYSHAVPANDLPSLLNTFTTDPSEVELQEVL